MTGETPTLRPLGVGDVIDRVFTLYRARPWRLALIAAVPQLAYAIVGRLLGMSDVQNLERLIDTLRFEPGSGAPPEIPTDALAGAGFLGLAFLFFAILIFSVQAGALVDAFAARYLGRETTASESTRRALAAAPRLIGAGLLASGALLVVLATAFALSFVAALFTFVVGPAGFLLLVSILVAGVAAVFYLGASFVVVPVVAMLESAGPARALRRSWSLTGRSRWRILALLLLLLVLQFVLGGLLSVVFLASFVAQPAVRALLQEAANLVAATIAAPLQWGTFTVLYYDLRVRREAFDLQLAAEQLPSDP